MTDGRLRVAAVADVHVRSGDQDRVEALFRNASEDADVLVIAGDLTDHGRVEEAEILEDALEDVGIPVIGVLGNHDHESGQHSDVVRILEAGGIRVLDRGETMVVDGVGFVGVKGFCGGFGDRIVRAFGEAPLKDFVTASVLEAESLRKSLNSLDTERRFAVLHYAPVQATVEGEPVAIHPFLGTSRLGDALDVGHADVAVHGHAHHGSPEGKTPKGVPVYNVSLPVLRESGAEKGYRVIEV